MYTLDMEKPIDDMVVQLTAPRQYLDKQKEVLDAMEKWGKRFVLYSGAFGAGKTLLECNAVIRQCLMHKKSLWLMGCQTIPMLRDTIIRTFLQEVDNYQLEFKRAGIKKRVCEKFLRGDKHYKFFNGSEVIFRSFDDPSKFKSLNLDGFAIDEPVDIDYDVFKMLQGRLRGKAAPNCKAILAGNPAGKTNWVYQKWFNNPEPEYYHVHTTTYDNLYLPKNYIPDMEKSYDSDYIRRYLKGEWGSFEGQVYKDFDVEHHVGDFAKEANKYKYIIAGYDDGFRNPACLLVGGVDSDNRLFILHEFYQNELTSKEIVDRSIYPTHRNFRFRKLYPDPSASNIIEIMRKSGIPLGDTNNDLDEGIAKLKGFFNADIIFIDATCKNLIKELESYRYAKDRHGKNVTEEPIKKDDHACDALRYMVTDFEPFRQPTFIKSGRFKLRR